MALAEKYQGLHDAFDAWLCDSEVQAALPVKTEGDPLEIRRQLEEMKVGCRDTSPSSCGSGYFKPYMPIL